jgi:uncharacterized repeat protein (TIGR03806 family)
MNKAVLAFGLALGLVACGGDGSKSKGTNDAGSRNGDASTGDAMANDASQTPAADAATDAGQGGVPLDETPDMLSGWNLFTDLPSLTPAARVVPYDMNSPLFTDYAEKHRFIYLPEGKQIGYAAEGAWQFPLGSILIKHFAYLENEAAPEQGERPIETRLLIHRAEGWVPEVYVWNEAGTDAARDVTGEIVSVTRKLAEGGEQTFDYGVPSRAECRKCHGTTPPIEGATATRVLGPMTAQLNRQRDFGEGLINQIDHFAALGLFDVAPEPAAARATFPEPDDQNVSAAERARAYLHANCAHCHSKGGEVFDKQLWLDFDSTGPDGDPYAWGVCKKPTSAGNAECSSTLDVVPGDPDASLLVCRMEALGKGKMAPLGRNLVHAEGVALVRRFISELELPPCVIE